MRWLNRSSPCLVSIKNRSWAKSNLCKGICEYLCFSLINDVLLESKTIRSLQKCFQPNKFITRCSNGTFFSNIKIIYLSIDCQNLYLYFCFYNESNIIEITFIYNKSFVKVQFSISCWNEYWKFWYTFGDFDSGKLPTFVQNRILINYKGKRQVFTMVIYSNYKQTLFTEHRYLTN